MTWTCTYSSTAAASANIHKNLTAYQYIIGGLRGITHKTRLIGKKKCIKYKQHLSTRVLSRVHTRRVFLSQISFS